MSRSNINSVPIKFQLLALLLVAVSACSNPSKNNTRNIGRDAAFELVIVNRVWELSGYQTSDGTTLSFTSTRGHKFTIILGLFEMSGGRVIRHVNGVDTCNTYGGEFSMKRNVLLLSNISATAADCLEKNKQPGIVFSRVLKTSPKILLQGNRLQLLSDGNERLHFTDRTQSI